MQAENWRSCWRACACVAGLTAVGPLFGKSFSQACTACPSCGARGSMPPVVTADIENCPCAFGSGKFGSPCERTQAANFVICRTLPRTSANDDRPATFPDDALEVPDAPPLFVPVVGVLVVAMLATDADVDPPHPLAEQ